MHATGKTNSAFLGALACLCLSCPAHAFTATTQIDTVTITAYAPDWIWQDREVNILLVAEDAAGKPIQGKVELFLPGEHPGTNATAIVEPFTCPGERTKSLEASAGKAAREAFAGIAALSRTEEGKPIPLGLHDFCIRINTELGQAEIHYPVKTIRGAAVEPGPLALYLPAAIALAWCVLFFVVLTRMSAPKAWLRISERTLPMAEEPDANKDLP